MSHFTQLRTRLMDQAALLLALNDLGFSSEKVLVPEQAKPLYGYRGDRREQTAEIIIRRKHISDSSNDIGFKRQPDGSFSAIISEYDADDLGYNQAWLNKLQQRYTYHATIQHLATQGFSLIQTEDANGELTLTLMRS